MYDILVICVGVHSCLFVFKEDDDTIFNIHLNSTVRKILLTGHVTLQSDLCFCRRITQLSS